VLYVIQEELTIQIKFVDIVQEKLIPFPNKKYKIIYADPPWPYSKYRNLTTKTHDKVRTTPYAAMTLEDIKRMEKLNI